MKPTFLCEPAKLAWSLLTTVTTLTALLLSQACGHDVASSGTATELDPLEAELQADALGIDRAAYLRAAAGEAASIELAKTGLQHAGQPAVLNYARALMRTHIAQHERLSNVARRRGGLLPPPQNVPRLALQAGPTFDSDFLAMQLDLQGRAVFQLDTLARDTGDDELRAWALQALDRGRIDQAWAAHLQRELSSRTF